MGCSGVWKSTRNLSSPQVVQTPRIGIEPLRTILAFGVGRQHAPLTLDVKAAFLDAQLLPREEAEVAVERSGPSQVQRQ